MTPEHKTASRASFEAYAATVNNLAKNAAMLDRQPSGNYTWSGTAFAWDVWQAARQHDAEVMKQNYDLLKQALVAAKLCSLSLMDMGGAAATEIAEEEYPQILKAIKAITRHLSSTGLDGE